MTDTADHIICESSDDLPREGQIIFDLEFEESAWHRAAAPWGYRIGDHIWSPRVVNSRWELQRIAATCLVSYLRPGYGTPEWVDLEGVTYFLAHLDQDDWWSLSERDIPPGVRRAESRHREEQVPLWPVRKKA